MNHLHTYSWQAITDFKKHRGDSHAQLLHIEKGGGGTTAFCCPTRLRYLLHVSQLTAPVSRQRIKNTTEYARAPSCSDKAFLRPPCCRRWCFSGLIPGFSLLEATVWGVGGGSWLWWGDSKKGKKKNSKVGAVVWEEMAAQVSTSDSSSSLHSFHTEIYFWSSLRHPLT